MVKEFLSRHQVSYEVRLLTEETHRRAVLGRGRRGGPLTIIGPDEVFGYNRSALREALSRAGLIDPNARADAPAAGAARLDLAAPLADGLAVVNFLGDSLTLLDAGKARPAPPGARDSGPPG